MFPLNDSNIYAGQHTVGNYFLLFYQKTISSAIFVKEVLRNFTISDEVINFMGR